MIKRFMHWKNEIPTFSSRTHHPFFPLQQEINKAFNDFYNTLTETPYFHSSDMEKLFLHPSVDIVEDDNNFKVEAEMPGMDENDINVSIEKGTLYIRGKKEISRKDEGKNYIAREIGYGQYERNIPLPDYVDTNNAKATFKKGMLWVSFPKKIDTEKQQAQIKVEKAAEA